MIEKLETFLRAIFAFKQEKNHWRPRAGHQSGIFNFFGIVFGKPLVADSKSIIHTLRILAIL